MTDFHSQFFEKLYSTYPSTKDLLNLPSLLQNLISNRILDLPQSVLNRVQIAVKKIYAQSRTPEYLQLVLSRVSPQEREILLSGVQNASVLMGYDFHYDFNSDQLSLIEINTNASAYLFVDLLYKTFSGYDTLALDRLHKSFLHECELAARPGPHKIFIIDENLETQKMYSEFHMYKELFNSWGWPAQVAEFNDRQIADATFIYNRHTDFTLINPSAAHLRDQFLSKKCVFSPNPREYILLADKSRFVELHAAGVSEVIIPTQIISTETDQKLLWEKRKKLFFKPRNSYGSKASYRGASISRKYFDDLVNKDFVAQEFRPPGEIDGWKFDLRFFVYQDEIHLSCARMYQGQVTNFMSLGGGLARLKFN